MQVVLAMLAATGWGASTTLAGRVARSGSVLSLTFWSQLLGFVAAWPVLFLAGASSASWHILAAGAVAGVGVGFSLYLLYMSTRFLFVGVASALSAVVSCALPVIYSSFRHPVSPQALAGLLVCLAAIVIVARWRPSGRRRASPPEGSPFEDRRALADLPLATDPPSSPDRRLEALGVAIALVSGLGLAVYYVALAGTSVHAQLWEALDSRFVSSVVVAVAALFTGRRFVGASYTEIKAAAPIAGVGIVAALAYASAIRASSVAVVVPIASLSPVVTMLLGWLVLDERMSNVQFVGVALAMIGVVLVTA